MQNICDVYCAPNLILINCNRNQGKGSRLTKEKAYAMLAAEIYAQPGRQSATQEGQVPPIHLRVAIAPMNHD